MYERFTERARIVVVLAHEEATALRHDYIGTEHLLLGLLREEEGVAAQALTSLGVTEKRVRSQVALLVGTGTEASPHQIPFSADAKDALELAVEESLNLGRQYIGTEHLLLGVLGEAQGIAIRVLDELRVHGRSVRNAVIDRLADDL